MDDGVGVFQKGSDVSRVQLLEVITADSWKGPFDHIEKTKALLCSQRVMMFEREVGCDPNTQIFLQVERGDVTSLCVIVDDESIRRGASKGHMSALSVVDGKVPRDWPVL